MPRKRRPILTGEDVYQGRGRLSAAQRVVQQYWPVDVPAFPMGQPSPETDAAPLAYVNWGRWVVDCPNPQCGSAQVASADDPRFMCTACLNVLWGGRWLQVRWPDAAKREAIEGELRLRPHPANRNWFPWERVEDLVTENVVHGARKVTPLRGRSEGGSSASGVLKTGPGQAGGTPALDVVDELKGRLL